MTHKQQAEQEQRLQAKPKEATMKMNKYQFEQALTLLLSKVDDKHIDDAREVMEGEVNGILDVQSDARADIHKEVISKLTPQQMKWLIEELTEELSTPKGSDAFELT
jgi:hypothetical protein